MASPRTIVEVACRAGLEWKRVGAHEYVVRRTSFAGRLVVRGDLEEFVREHTRS